ncbi:RNA polymerase sigma factor, partial [Monoglobus pectinilyticus]|uniref:RNA polymerase sigma factor n=1 Tax=Monoglobus pectinilyticus TaxID=1981510 RepID=UPI00399B407E
MDDKKIIDLYFNRDESAIPETSSKYGRLINSIAYNILKNITDSEECENDTYYAAWNQIPPQKPRCLPAFLGRITRNIALNKYDYYSAAMRNREFETELSELENILSGGETPEEKYEAREVAEFISHFLKTKS